jgi:hypothetical protein
MSYTLEDFERDCFKEWFAKMTPVERREWLLSLPPEGLQDWLQSFPVEDRLAGLSEEQIREYLDRITADRPAKPRKPRRKK